MKKLLLVIISSLGFATLGMAQASETVETAASAQAQQSSNEAIIKPNKSLQPAIVSKQKIDKANAEKKGSASNVSPVADKEKKKAAAARFSTANRSN
jgi:hypothetical protein